MTQSTTSTGSQAYTSTAEFEAAYNTLHATYATHKTKDIRWRKWQLKQLWWLIVDNTDAICAALHADLGRTEAEARMYDIADVKKDIKECLDNIDVWARGHAAEGAGFLMGRLGGAWVRRDPLGVCLIIGAWNFPIMTLLSPLCPAIAAGNCVMLKPSELAGATAELMVELLPKYMDNSAIRIATGGPKETGLILERKWNHIFYTGGSRVGRIIATAAAKHLTPTVLELGGQAPAIICKSANVDLAAKRIANFKIANLGQICVNVNHIIADPEIYDAFLARLQHWLEHFLKEEAENPWLARIISPGHYDRIHSILSSTKGRILTTGPHEPSRNFVHPTIIADVALDDSVITSGELFAPLIPVIKADLSTALATLAPGSKMADPLALYIFSNSQPEIDSILNQTSSGGVSINDLAVQYGVPGAPFGGVGESGMGAYHGKWGFDSFSHARPVVNLPLWLEGGMQWRYGRPTIEKLSNFDTAKATWKRGETLEQQSSGQKGWFGWLW
ncbi:unnamed protein product [Zymoseptoria tritici ST99CH_1E4]|uniref:Aldehyde dehydrogenase n=1 Tax=Zymoseptoria tritici ST99CH_1E4 TaxID=1276532 RepID=A0A2H1GIM2_ZYMTR|nr:unnamed protein product [Zymoseptoria tritici ST99CH_1E4]